jgi:2',3'-cyclic-nucleotide 2'-phosphodiesterase (5'-nucleotidase family)
VLSAPGVNLKEVPMPWSRPILSLALLAGLAWPIAAVAEPVRLTILQVNDWDDMAGGKRSGGYARLVSILNAEQAARDDVLVVHAGDAFSPSLLSGFDQGAHVVALLNTLPLDLFVPGNHEFDFGKDVALTRFSEATFPIVSSNMRLPDGALLPGTVDSRTIEVGGFTLGFLGITTPTTREISSPGDIVFAPVLDTAKAKAEALRAAGADLVVAVMHTGLEDDLAVWRAGIADLVLTGHDHDLRVMYDGRSAMTEAGAQADWVMAIELELDRVEERGATKVVWQPRFRPIWSGDHAPDAEAQTRLAPFEAALATELDRPVGTTRTALDSRRAVVRGEEAAIGNLIADAMREATGADLAITNGGGIRGDTSYPAGTTLKRRDVLAELPFGNKTVLLEVDGATILAALENGFSQVEDGAGRFPQVAGMSVEVDLTVPPGGRVRQVTIGGAPIDPARTYRLATNDFMARGGDGYAMLKSGRTIIGPIDGTLMASQVIAAIEQAGSVAPAVEGRIRLRR